MAGFASILVEIGKDIVLASNIAGQLSPLIAGIAASITQVTNAQGEIEYTVIIKSGQESLDQSANNFKSALEKINEERARQNLPALDVPEVTIPDTPAPLPPHAPLPLESLIDAKRKKRKVVKGKSRR